jgi:NitT/TauT family transport system substrate-binding protein
MNKIKIVAGIIVVGFLALTVIGVWDLTNSPATNSGTPDSVTIGTTVQELAGLIFIADDRGFFAQNGLNVTVRLYDTGLAAVNDMANGKADVSASAEYPVVGTMLKQANVSVIGSIDKYQGQYLVGRKDRGIENIVDLSGKKIGVARGTSTEFYLTRFLFLNNISLRDVTLVDVRPAQFADLIGNGSVDAILVPQAYLVQVEGRLGSNAVPSES